MDIPSDENKMFWIMDSIHRMPPKRKLKIRKKAGTIEVP